VNATTPVFIYQSPQDSIISLTNAKCGLTNGAFEIGAIGSGPFVYSVSGVGGYSSNTPINTGLNAGTYTINITDTNGCSSSNMLSIANVSNLTNITGNIQTANGDDASNTAIVLYDANDTIGAMSISYSTTADVNGNYSFANLAEGNYILAAKPDSTLFPGALLTYSNGAAVWFDSDTIQVSCTSQEIIDITLLDAVAQSGTAQVGGFVGEYTFNMLNNVDLLLLDANTNQAVARTATDANGNYSFASVNAGYYTVFVDVPGLNHATEYTFNLTPNDIFWYKSYFVNFDLRTIDTVFFFVGVNEINNFESSVYPNPFNEQTTISYTLPITSNVNIEVYNFVGEKVETLVNETKTVGKHNVVFSTTNMAKGIYFIRFTAGNQHKIIKVISAE
jgi:5-hydroxyisourate hydrolase-like protein (transthyretin family)